MNKIILNLGFLSMVSSSFLFGAAAGSGSGSPQSTGSPASRSRSPLSPSSPSRTSFKALLKASGHKRHERFYYIPGVDDRCDAVVHRVPRNYGVITPALMNSVLEGHHAQLSELMQSTSWQAQSERLDRGEQPLPPYTPRTMRRASAPSALLGEKTVLESSKSSAAKG